MLITKFWGGLGNQMFQYALYLALKKRGANVLADLGSFEKYKAHFGFELHKVFSIELDLAQKKEVEKLIGNYYVRRFFEKYLKQVYKRHNYYFEKESFVYDANIFSLKNNKYIVGFWQNEKYFKEIESDLRYYFKFQQTLSIKNQECINKVQNNNSISVHIRRNDYLKIPKYMKIGSIDYYKNAIRYFISKYDNCVFFIFSDDIEWVKTNLKTGYETIYVDWNIQEESNMDMYLMSLCKHNIITISSFSWWAAWLNENINKEVVAPKSIEEEFRKGLLLDSWIKI